ncbi:hypothetical protein FPSE_10536 [Fusarium pseudograminearum CS3096]|uniref:Uncharacterized protein n=1 Tax=Fusarium pseudograminearum (strain CS3096) TaxID=1028729 RepID=K3VAT9_FUSPC|nr:hypothetical protein FPSE_10536 [Fusarium pseudograminearum CS3096]EKJ69283.1 hypothetical protein FPSE_10536 [Fusarium pseudograminearum CS3096]
MKSIVGIQAMSSLRTTPVPGLWITHRLIGIEPTAEAVSRRSLVIAPGNLVAVNTLVQYHEYNVFQMVSTIQSNVHGTTTLYLGVYHW